MTRRLSIVRLTTRLFSHLQTNAGANINTTAPWNTRLRELSRKYQYQQALHLYREMLLSGATPNAFTFPFALKSTAALALPVSGTQLHCHVIKTGCQSEPFVLTALISMYCKCSMMSNAGKVFDENPQSKNLTVSYNALISGYTQNHQFQNAIRLFNQMRLNDSPINAVTMLGLIPGCTAPFHLISGMLLHCCNVKLGLNSDLAVGNCLLTMYFRCGSIQLAKRQFDDIPEKGLITWNAMISGYAQNGFATHVLDLYREMESAGVCPDPVTYVGVLTSCANLGSKQLGRKIEQKIESNGFRFNSFLKNALINMYSRCGDLVRARQIFNEMPEKSLVSWTAVIGGYGIHGQGKLALELFDEMIKNGICPDKTVFVCVLSACSHAGLTDKGLSYLDAMEREFGLRPGPEHYACVVDLLGRAGRLEEARNLIKSMPVKPDGALWGALLGACKIHRNVELAKLAFEEVIGLEPGNIGYYVLMSNVYSEARNSEGVLRVRTMMREQKLKKDPGCSYVELKGKTHLFTAGDQIHSLTREIYGMLSSLEDLVNESGDFGKKGKKGIEDLENGLGDFGMKGKKGIDDFVHSEKLAIAFALLTTDVGTEILVIKNLRVCEDCHVFIKVVSSVLSRRFVVRDATRFHHFEHGVCSCNDYW